MPDKHQSAKIKRDRLIAVIDIGSSAIRLVVAEVSRRGMRILDSAERPVPLGRDVFTEGVIRRETLLQAVKVLTGFKEMIAAYPVTNTIAIGTSALREAENRDTFVDRILLRTGITVNVIAGIEANRLTYLAVREALADAKPSLTRSNAIIMEIGGGSTELMLLHRGNMVAAHTLPIGTTRIGQQFEPAPGAPLGALLRQNVRSTLDLLATELELGRVNQFIALGGDARLAAERVGEATAPQYWTIEKEPFCEFVRNLERLTVDQTVDELGITYAGAEPLLPALLVYQQFFEATAARTLVVPTVSIREGVLLDFALGTGSLRSEFKRQIIASAMSMVNKYMADEDHAVHVAQLALRFFDELRSEHGLGRHHRQLLEVAALLHDIGGYIRGSAHHKHGQYIVENSEIFGLSQDDIQIIGNVVRYHRKAKPSDRHLNYAALSRDRRMVVQKLAAILRVADALDRGHAGRIQEPETERTESQFIIQTNIPGDLSLERLSLQNKGDLFEDVFGLELVLR